MTKKHQQQALGHIESLMMNYMQHCLSVNEHPLGGTNAKCLGGAAPAPQGRCSMSPARGRPFLNSSCTAGCSLTLIISMITVINPPAVVTQPDAGGGGGVEASPPGAVPPVTAPSDQQRVTAPPPPL